MRSTIVTIAASAGIFTIIVALNGGVIDDQVRQVTAYCGFLTGIVIACPLEIKHINFDPRSSAAPAKILRYALSIFFLAAFLFGLKAAFRGIAPARASFGCALEYLRYTLADAAAMFLAPFVFCKLKLATARPEEPPGR